MSYCIKADIETMCKHLTIQGTIYSSFSYITISTNSKESNFGEVLFR